MTSLRMALTELQRLTTGRTARLAVLAMVVLPTLYGGLYLYANHDPYQRLDQVPAALVMLDAGATDTAGHPVQAGREVADALVAEHGFAWHEVGADAAARGVRDGRYDFALTIPADFSTALTSSARFDPAQARLTMTTNDANSYLSTTIADTVVARVREAITARVGSDAAAQFLLGFGRIRGSLEDAGAATDRLSGALQRASGDAQTLRRRTIDAAETAATVNRSLGTLRARADSLPGQARTLADTIATQVATTGRVGELGDAVAGYTDTAENAYYDRRAELVSTMVAMGLDPGQRSELLTVYDRIAGPVLDANSAAAQVAGQLRTIGSRADALTAPAQDLLTATRGLGDAADTAAAAAGSLSSTSAGIQRAAGRIDATLTRVADRSAALSTSLSDQMDAIPSVDEDQRAQIASTISDPVAIADVAQTSAGSYGAGLAPFFLSLATWVGAYALLLLARPLSKRAMAANQAPLRVALGGLLPPALLGIAQILVMVAVVTWVVGIVPANVPGTIAFLALASLCFVALVHALKAWFGAAGQFLGLVLLVLQLVTAGGTFPWQTLPAPLHPLHQVLSMSYAVDGLRQLLYGGFSGRVWQDAAVLAGWLVVAVVAGTAAARRQRIWTVRRVKPGLAL